MIALAHPRFETTVANQPEGQRTIAELTKTVSASRLSTWQRCRLQFYFRYVAGIQKSPTPALHIGTTVHTLLQHWNRGISASLLATVRRSRPVSSDNWEILRCIVVSTQDVCPFRLASTAHPVVQ